MTRRLDQMSKAELIREVEKLRLAERRVAATAGEQDRERLIRDLHVHQVELETQNRELRETQERLEESRERYSDLYDQAPVGYCTMDRDGHIREINLMGARLLGASRDALIGQSFPAVAPLKNRRLFHAHLRRCLQEKARVSGELTFSLGKQGTRTMQIVSEPLFGAGGAPTGYRTVLLDISELKQLEDKLRLLAEAGAALASSLDYGTTLEVAARVAVPALADLCMIDVVGEGGRAERAVVAFADAKKQRALADRMRRFAPRPGWRTPQARVAESGEPMLLEEISDELRARIAHDDEHAQTLRIAEIRSLMVVPLSTRGRVLGTLTLATAESDRRYSWSDLGLAQDLASRAAMAVDNARLYANAQRANEQLRVSEARASGLLTISVDAIISVDEQQRITLFNEGAERIFGYTRAEAIGAPLAMLIPERLRSAHLRDVEQFAAGEEISRRMGERGAPISGLRKNGEEFPAEAAISKLVIDEERILTVAVRDITQQKQIEKEQRFLAEVGLLLATSTLEYEETLSKIVQVAVRDLGDLCLVDVVEKDGRVRRQKVVSRDPSKAPLCEALSAVPLDRRLPHLTGAALQTRQPVLMERMTPELVAALAQSEEHRRLLLQLDLRSCIVVPLLAHGNLLGAIALVSTTPTRIYGPADLRLAEELARRAALSIENADLYRAAQRAIRARDEALGIVAHDLRNPLGNILMQAALLRQQGAGHAHWSCVPAQAIERAANRMNRLIKDLLDVTRMEAGGLLLEKVRIPTTQVVADAAEAQWSLASSASLELRLDIAHDLPEVTADRDRILQVFENLIGNALKFTRPGGRITIGARLQEGDVLFWVKDTGAGIAPEEMPHLFDRFWQARKSGRHGAGLGLPIVKGIVEAHGGRVWVESQVGVGSTFFFALPAVNAAQPPAKPDPPARVVLIAEDDTDAREALAATLEEAGYEVVTVTNGAEAFAYLHRASPPFSIILDLMMPVMDGWAFLAEKNRDPGLRPIPVIVVSAQRDVESRAVAAGACGYVQKPVVPDRLIETLAHVLH